MKSILNQIERKSKRNEISPWPRAAIDHHALRESAMAARTRNASWMEDLDLKEELQKYVRQGLKRDEILNFMERDFGDYAWSLRTRDRRMRHFDIRYTNTDVTVEEVKSAVRKELDGPGKLLGYRAMHNNIRQEYLLNVPRNLVHAVIFDADPEGLEARCPTVKKGKTKGHFSTKGTNWVHSMDGHDKLMGYQNSTFPLAIYGSIDTASRKILWLKIWTGNSDPKRIARWYSEHLHENRTIASHIRIDRGNETGIMALVSSPIQW